MSYDFAVNLTDNVTPTAKASGDAVAELSAKMRLAQADIAGMAKEAKESQTKMQAFASGVSRVGETMKMVVGQIRGLGSELMSGNFHGAVDRITNAVAGSAKMLDAVMPGLGTAVSTIASIGGSVLSWAVGAIEKITSISIAASTGRRQTLAMYSALAEGHATGEEVAAMIGKLGDRIGWTGSQLKPFAKELMAMGHRDLPDLKRELLAVASAQAIMGEGAGEMYIAMARKITHAGDATGMLKLSSKQLDKMLEGVGISANDMAEKLGMSLTDLDKKLKSGTVNAAEFGNQLRDTLINRGKGPLEDFRNSLGAIKNRFDKLLTGIFAKVDVTPFLRALSDIVDAFGGATKGSDGMVSTLNAGFAWAGKAVKWLVLAIMDVAIWALQAGIAVRDFFAESGAGSAVIDNLKGIFEGLKIAVFAVVGQLMMMADALKAIERAKNAITGGGRVSIAMSVGKAQGEIAGAQAAVDEQRAHGQAMALGLAAGINGGAYLVTDAARKMAKDASSAVKNELEVKSPSRVMVEVGGNVAEGFAVGVREKTPIAEGAVKDMSRSVVRQSEPVNTNGGARGEAASRTVHIENIHVEISGAGASAQEITEDMVAATFEKIALMTGTG